MRPATSPSKLWRLILAALAPLAASLHVSVETWRFLPHSYAVVGQFMALHLNELAHQVPFADVSVTLYDAPLYMASWRQQRDLWPVDVQRALESMPLTSPTACPDVVFRAYFPINLEPWPSSLEAGPGRPATRCRPRLYVFGTTEYGIAGPVMLANLEYHWGNIAANVLLVPPSQWALDGFLASGAAPDRLWLLPHGFDPQVFR